MSDGSGSGGHVVIPPQTERGVSRNELITWALSAMTALALAVGAWFCAGVQTAVSDLAKVVTELRVQLATDHAEAVALQKRVERLEGLHEK